MFMIVVGVVIVVDDPVNSIIKSVRINSVHKIAPQKVNRNVLLLSWFAKI